METNSIDFEYVGTGPHGYGYAISGPIKCDKGFKVRFDLRSPHQGHTNWYDTLVYLVAHDKDTFDKWCWGAFEVHEKEDKTFPFYGVFWDTNDPCNLKKKSKTEARLSRKEPIYLEYARKSKTVKFWSSGFEYHQTDVSEGRMYCIGIWFK